MAADEAKEVVIVGLGPAGLYASKGALNTNRKCHVTIIERRDYDMFSPCSLPYVIEGVIGSFDDIVYPLPGISRNMEKVLSTEVVSVDHEARTVLTRSLKDGLERTFRYDSLVLSNGSSPFMPPIPGMASLSGVHTVSGIEDAKKLNSDVVSGGKAVVIGAGAIGLETAVALKARGMDVTIVEMMDRCLPNSLDADMSGLLGEHLATVGIRMVLGKRLLEVKGNGKVRKVVTDGGELDTDLLVMSVGVRPDTTLAEKAGCQVSRRGIVTDDRMRTTVEGIYAAGDCVETYDPFTGQRAVMWLATSAYQQGLVAGSNAAGGDMRYKGARYTFVSRVHDLEVASTGLTSDAAKRAGIEVVAVKAKGLTRPHYFPGHSEVNLKLIFRRDDARLVGAQCIGREGAASRIDLASVAIQGRMDVNALSSVELAYAPPVSEMYDVFSLAVDLAAKRLGR